jgi:hypothetical protein
MKRPRTNSPCHKALWLALALGACSASRHGANATAHGPKGSFDNPTQGSAASGAGHAGSGSSAVGYQVCTVLGATRSCCGSGVQTCTGEVEFANWGPCLDRKGSVVSCPHSCAEDEFGRCDAGTPLDAGHYCGQEEFSPSCDAGMPSLCTDKTINNEPEILAGYSPASNESVGIDGQIKVWITDEAAAIIAESEQIDPATGLITAAGDRTAKAHDGYLWEPALYIAPQTAERGGAPHFPNYIRGWYNNVPPLAGAKPAKGAGTSGAAIEQPPSGARLSERYNSEDVWNVSDLGLAPGVYIAEFVIHDGDTDRGVGCVTIKITP